MLPKIAANAIGEPPENPQLLFLVLSGYFTANVVAGNVEACRDVADRVLELAEIQGRLAELVLGHLCVGTSLLLTGEITRGKVHLDHAITLYDPGLPRASMAREDPRVAALIFRSIALWMLGHPEAALADASGAIKNARALGYATPLMFALAHAELTYMLCGNYAAGGECLRELVALADVKGSLYWKTAAQGMEATRLALTGDPANSIPMMISMRNAYEATGAKFLAPFHLSVLSTRVRTH